MLKTERDQLRKDAELEAELLRSLTTVRDLLARKARRQFDLRRADVVSKLQRLNVAIDEQRAAADAARDRLVFRKREAR